MQKRVTSKNYTSRIDELVYGVLFKDISKASVLLTGVRNGDNYATVVSKLYR